MKLPPRQAEAFSFIKGYIKKHGYAPLQREIMEALGANSCFQIQQILFILDNKGLIEREFGVARGIILCDEKLTRGQRTVIKNEQARRARNQRR